MRTLFLIAAFAVSGLGAAAQKPSQTPVDPELPGFLIETTSPSGPAFLRNVNGGLTLISVHDSATGWYTVMTPAAAYTWRRYSLEASFPLYLYRLAQTERPTAQPAPGQPAIATTRLTPQTFDPGDLYLTLHANFNTRRIATTVSPSMTIPSGDSKHGLSTGRVTFDLDDYSYFRLAHSALILDLGAGDSSNAVDPLVTKNYSSLGPLAHFQFGGQVPLPFHSTFQSLVYEQLPLGDNKIYSTIKRRGFPDRTIVSGRSVSEDNGFSNSLGVPLSRKVTFQAYYNRSLRLKLDSIGFGLSYTIRDTRTDPSGNR